MKPPRLFCLLLFAVVVCLGTADTCPASSSDLLFRIWTSGYPPYSPLLPMRAGEFNGSNETHHNTLQIKIVAAPTDGGIREDVPAGYRSRFEKWKAEFRSTEYGRQQWDQYANNKKFVLTIKVTSDRGKGAGTDKFLWDQAGNFVGATITLGAELDDGYPSPVYYPVLNSLSSDAEVYSVSREILAATKISHEIGHVNQAAKADMRFLELQNKLTPDYISIFLKNGRNANDKKLIELAQQMGGTPVEIWESREYWSEVNAMLFLRERISKEIFYCDVFNKIRYNLREYARDYEQRFDQYYEHAGAPCWK